MNNNFGNYISRSRRNSKMSQEQLAEKMEVSKTTIQNWESGRTKVKPTHLKRLAYLFNVSEKNLIDELTRDNDSRENTFPFFLIEDNKELVDIIKSLHLNLNQQELFGLICLYSRDSLQHISQNTVFNEAILKIPYEFVSKIGSIHFMNLLSGLKELLKYVDPEFLLKVLKLFPDEVFDVTRLSKNLIIEFLDSGHLSFEEDFDDTVGFDFNINMKKAKNVLPILEKGDIYLSDSDQLDAPLSDEVPQEIIDATEYPPNPKCLLFYVLNGLDGITDIYDEKRKYYVKINELGHELLRWFQEKE